jgi:ferredoxin
LSKRTDERDIIFSRMGYKPGDENYIDYYGNHPQKEEPDRLLRNLPGMGSPGSSSYDPVNSPIVDASFLFLADIGKFSEGVRNPIRTETDPEVMTKRLKGLASFYGAKLVGIARMEAYHFYSHRGRRRENYGQEIMNFHPYGVAFAVEMDREMIHRAPKLPESIAVTKGYVDAAIVGMILSYYIRSLGYDARNHMDGNYLVVAPLAARDAGLGEMGRSGMLITKEYGPRVRLGVVTTDMPLVCDRRRDFGVAAFCMECGKCAAYCPGKAIPGGEPVTEDGEERWALDADACYRRWRLGGTDCGICLAACPFSEGVSAELIDRMSESPEARGTILRDFEEKHKTRPYIKSNPDWLE